VFLCQSNENMFLLSEGGWLAASCSFRARVSRDRRYKQTKSDRIRKVKSQESRVKNQESRIKSQEFKSQESRVKNQESKIKSQKLRVKNQESKIKS